VTLSTRAWAGLTGRTAYSGEAEDDGDVEAGEVRARISASFPEIELASVERLGAGWDFEAWLANEDLVFRFALRADGFERIAREARLLPELAGGLPLPIPEPLYVATDPENEAPSFIAYRRLPGNPLGQVSLSPAASEAVAGQLADFLTRLHSFPLEQARPLVEPYKPAVGQPWLLRERWRLDIAPIFEAEERVAVEDRWDRFEKGFEKPEQLCLVHADLGQEHVLVDTEGGRVTGILDWAEATIGDPALDFAGLEPQLRRRVLAAYGGRADATLLNRVEFYRWLHPIHHIDYGLYYGGGRDAVEEGVKELLASVGME
jgi:aminoglycoside 2''-phosphotransferase